MSKEKLTPWFDVEVKPIHTGVYETYFNTDSPDPNFPGYSYWNGTFWGNQWSTKSMAEKSKGLGDQDKLWRGLAQKP